jgi:hypothetical protein
MVAVGTSDTQHGARHAAADAAPATSTGNRAAGLRAASTPDTSQRVSFHTAQTSLIRGPPEQALA